VHGILQRIMIYAGVIVALYVFVVAMMYLGQRKLLYHPSRTLGTPAAHGIAEVVPIKLKSTDGLTITSWFRAAGTNKPILVYFHGNAGNVGDRASKVRPFLDAGYGILLVGYRGYGLNSGSPTEAGLYADAATALDFLMRTEIAPDHWILYGESLGTAVAVEMAVRFAKSTPVGAVVLEAPFTSMIDAAKSHYPYIPVNLLLLDRFETIAKIRHIDSPLFIFHGSADATVPQTLGKRLFDEAADPKSAKWIDGAGHSNLYEYGADKDVLDFIKRKRSKGVGKVKN